MASSTGQKTAVIRCLDCGYVLNGLDGRCPECGRTFNRADPKTYSDSKSRSRSRSIRAGLAMIGGFSIVIIGGGCGIAPLGLLYAAALTFDVSYGDEAWAVWPVALGWLGLLVAGFAWAWPSPGGRRTSLALAGVLLGVVWAYFLKKSELQGFTAVTAIPFFLALARTGWVLAFDWPAD
jgi:DNA-directed RNA polymerase subunit RPC12/RpoP